MAKSLSGFRAALLIGWIVLSVAGIMYARLKGIPSWAALPVLAAFLLEYPFYLVPAFPILREQFSGIRLPGYLLASAILPYLACCFGAVQFQWSSLLQLAALALALGLWFLVLPPRAWVDIAFLVLCVSVLLGKYFQAIYLSLFPGWKDLIVLGHLSLIQMGVMALLLERRVSESGYGFVPNWQEWRIGALHFVYFILVGFPLAFVLNAVNSPHPAPLWKILGSFLASLWVLSLSEEFFFRGVLQQWVEEWTWNRTAALIVTSIAFGLSHLGFRGFPNWRWVLIAAVLGWFCGRARNQAGSIRASMVTHALVFTAWRSFFA